MRSKILLYAACLLATLCMVVPAAAGPVIQGKCISVDPEKKIVVVEEYDLNFSKEHKYGMPTGKNTTIDISGALIGIHPSPGDILRIAYEEKGSQKKAIRVMNVSRQDLMKK